MATIGKIYYVKQNGILYSDSKKIHIQIPVQIGSAWTYEGLDGSNRYILKQEYRNIKISITKEEFDKIFELRRY